MISLAFHKQEFVDRVAIAERLMLVTHRRVTAHTPSVAREARGIVTVLLFGAYEHLLTSLTRSLLEEAQRMGVGNRRLQPGFRAMAMHGAAASFRDSPTKKLFSRGLPGLVHAADPGGRSCTINSDLFPNDGSFMRQSQILVWCDLFGVPDPNLILHRTWAGIDGIVSHRNAIAHGRRTAEEVGREFSESDTRNLISDWKADWLDFLDRVEYLASSRDFFRLPR